MQGAREWALSGPPRRCAARGAAAEKIVDERANALRRRLAGSETHDHDHRTRRLDGEDPGLGQCSAMHPERGPAWSRGKVAG